MGSPFREEQMTTIQHILCPVDFSPESNHALKYGINLAKKLGAEVHIAHVFDIPAFALPDGAIMASPEFATKIMNAAQDQLDALEKAHSDSGVKIHCRLMQGVPSEGINQLCEVSNADLVVMGTHGRAGISHFLLGSVTERVVRTSKIPVLTIRLPEEANQSAA